jgi:hypothetical protein
MRIRFLVAIVTLVGCIALNQTPEARAQLVPVFEITGSGKLYHFEGVPTAGVKPGVTTVNAAAIAACITGVGVGCTNSNLETDAGGKAYLYLPTDTQAFIGTNTTCDDLTELTGLVGGDGSFMFSGEHDLSNTRVIVQGKVTFLKGTFSPTSIKKASVLAVSTPLEHYAIGTFSTVGAVFGVSCL